MHREWPAEAPQEKLRHSMCGNPCAMRVSQIQTRHLSLHEPQASIAHPVDADDDPSSSTVAPLPDFSIDRVRRVKPEEFSPPAAPGRVKNWRVGLGRRLCSLLARPFIRECHSISILPRFQPPHGRTPHADFPHDALLPASRPSLMGPILPERLSSLADARDGR